MTLEFDLDILLIHMKKPATKESIFVEKLYICIYIYDAYKTIWKNTSCHPRYSLIFVERGRKAIFNLLLYTLSLGLQFCFLHLGRLCVCMFVCSFALNFLKFHFTIFIYIF